MGLFRKKELCDYIRWYHANPDKISETILDMFHEESEHISVQTVINGIADGKLVSGFSVYSATNLERHLNGGRMYFLYLEQ